MALVLIGALKIKSKVASYHASFTVNVNGKLVLVFQLKGTMWLMYLPLQGPWLTKHSIEALMCTVH